MINWTEEKLKAQGYKIENATITKVDLSMADHACFTLSMVLEGNGWGCVYGGSVLGYGYVGANEFKGSKKGMEYIMRIMDMVDCDTFNSMEGKNIRVATKGWGDRIKIIGHLIKDKWFDANSFFICKAEEE